MYKQDMSFHLLRSSFIAFEMSFFPFFLFPRSFLDFVAIMNENFLLSSDWLLVMYRQCIDKVHPDAVVQSTRFQVMEVKR